MFLPSGDQIAPSASLEIFVIAWGEPVILPVAESKSAIHTCWLPLRAVIKMNRLPSGDHRPLSSPVASLPSCRGSPPARGTTQRWVVFLLSFRLTSCAENSTHLPSGEICGLPIRLRDIMSAKVNALFLAVGAGVAVWAHI